MKQASIAALIGLAALAGCADFSTAELQAQCPATDWQAYGLEDGRQGQPIRRAESFFEGCQEVGITPDLAAYRAGRAQGLREYCTAENGYSVGLALIDYHKVCPPELETAFLQGLRRGRADSPNRAYHPGVYPRIGVGVGIGIGSHRHRGVGSGIVIGF